MARDIFCRCGKKVGEIRDASLMVGIVYLCPPCSSKNGKSEFFEALDKAFKNGSSSTKPKGWMPPGGFDGASR
jgi:hypothetical protein